MAIYMHAVRDGYAVDDGQNQSTLVPILTPYGEQRVVIDNGGLSVSASNPLPVTLSSSTDSLLSSFSTQPDYSITGSASQLTSLAAVSQGILVTAHPSNTAVIRVSGSTVSTTQGQPLGPGASFTFPVTNANILWAISEAGTQKLCVSAI